MKNKLCEMYQSWLERYNSILDQYLNDHSFDNKKLANEVEMSERHLFRKVKELTGLSPQRYFRKYRLHYAMEYLKKGKIKTVKGTAAAVGFLSTSYFISQFEKEFGKKPLSVLKEAGWR
ncbi:MAG: helix-turn-helix domain-containing protein [Bacteroidota bacterium]